MTIVYEGPHTAEFILSEASGSRSRENGVVASGQVLEAGEVVGKRTLGAATGAAVAGNTGAATITASPTVGLGAKVGVYQIVCTSAGATADFTVEDPDGIIVGVGNVGTAFSGGGLGFTITDAGTDPGVGDRFTVTVAAGTGKLVAYDPEATTGAAVVAGILLGACDATDGDVPAAYIARDAEVNRHCLTYPEESTAGGEEAATFAGLAALGIIVR